MSTASLPMKKQLFKNLVVLVFLALAVHRAPADILAPGMAAPDAIGQINSLETKDGFSAQFWMTTEEQIFSTWAKTGAIRGLKPAIQVKRNLPVYLALFFANPGVRSVVKRVGGKPKLSSDVTFDLYIISPSGSLGLTYKQRIAWMGVPPSPGLVYLARDRGVLSFEAIDALGEYTIVVVVHDNVRKTDLRLTRKLELAD